MVDSYGITREQLRALAEEPKEKAVAALANRYGGVEGIAEQLGVDLKRGLTSDDREDLERRKLMFGTNRLPVPKQRSLLLLMWDALHDVTLIILLAAGLVSLIIGLAFEEDKATGWIEGAAILGAVAAVVLVASVNDYQKEKQFRKLNAVKEECLVNVIRDGAVKQASKYDIVVGDIVLLAQGDELVADGIVFEASSLTANEAALTGESDDVKKQPGTAPFAFSGTQIMDGVGRMLVTAVGENSQAGIIYMLITGQAKRRAARNAKSARPSTLSSEPSGNGTNLDHGSTTDAVVDLDRLTSGLDGVPDSSSKKAASKRTEAMHAIGGSALDVDGIAEPNLGIPAHGIDIDTMSGDSVEDADDEESGTVLQRKLERLAVLIGYIGLIVGTATFLVLVVRFCIETYTTRGWESGDFSTLLDYFIIGITVLVVAIPEGLPLAVTLALAFSMTQMIKENNLVRHLDACETMGSATTICSDKTGTLTTNRMTVVKATMGHTETDGRPLMDAGATAEVADLYVEATAVNSTAEVQPPASGVGVCDHIGSKTECALLQHAMDMGANYNGIRAAKGKVHMSPFSSAKKRMTTVINTGDNRYRAHTKGASEIVLELCTKVLTMSGDIEPMTDTYRNHFLATIEDYAQQSLRTLCLAYKDVTAPADGDWDSVPEEVLEQDMVLLVIVGIEDPLRPEVPGAIVACKRAGITVRMVTGDNLTTARSIAKKCGILHEEQGDLVMEGPDFRARVLDENDTIIQDEIDKIWPRLRVLARSSPTDKYTLVSGILQSELNKDKEVVAVTGDGTNDAPALKRADIGFAMGIQGTSVAKNASDIILMDDNFSSIVVALKWGRNVYDSIAKFVQFQLTVNVAALVVSFVSAAVTKTTPLTAVQLLWVNLIMDTLAALALATERPTDALLNRKPYGRDRPLVSRRMWWFIINHAIYQVAILFFVQYAGADVFGLPSGMDAEGEYPTQHYTMVFNTFVLCQLFNEINARKLHGEWNVFKGIFNNVYFVVIMVFQFAFQAIIVQFGGRVFMTEPLTGALWGWCLLMGAGELIWNQLINFVPVMVPKSWKVYMKQPFVKSFWLKSKRRLRSTATRPFRKSMKSNPAANKSTRSLNQRRTDILTRRPEHMSFYESALRMLVMNSKSPKVRLHATMWLVHERIRSESQLLQTDSFTNLREHKF